MTSRMPAKYIHFFGSESSETLLEAYGIVRRSKTLAEILKPKECPSCRTPNKLDARFCSNPTCRMILTFDAYQELQERERVKEKEAAETKAKMDEIYRILYEQGLIKQPQQQQ